MFKSLAMEGRATAIIAFDIIVIVEIFEDRAAKSAIAERRKIDAVDSKFLSFKVPGAAKCLTPMTHFCHEHIIHDGIHKFPQ